VQVEATWARAVGLAMLRIATHVLVQSAERAAVSGSAADTAAETWRWVVSTVDRVRRGISAGLYPGAPPCFLSSEDPLTGRNTSVSHALCSCL
jgi:hypothetical protein